MLQKGQRYQLRDGKQVDLVEILTDYFTSGEAVLLRQNDQIFVANRREFEANIVHKEVTPIAKRTTQDKINLFRSYFRGRETMLATSFKNAEGKMVYYPFCLNRKKFPCPKLERKFQCVHCKYQAFQPYSDQMVLNHFRGRDENGREAFYGIYPMLPNNHVFFLSIDFDKKDWQLAVSALEKVARKYALQPLLEISQSGRGCHVWFFFEEEVPAKKARNLGDELLKLSMLENPELTFASYDRMFPNQDELVPGGFGNLIALPLQGNRVNLGCSRFVDQDYQLIANVWDALQETPKISTIQLQQTIEKMSKEMPVAYYSNPVSPATEISLFENSTTNSFVLAKKIDVTIKNTMSISRSSLKNEELVRLKYLATFHNKAFYTAQRKQLSTKDIPRRICLAEMDSENIYLPRGLEHHILAMFPQAKVIDQRTRGKQMSVSFIGTLYPEQQLALEKMCQQDMGILCAGTGFGKTITAAKLIAEKSVSTLILVHNKTIASQWTAQLERFLQIEDEPFEELTKTGRKKRKSKIGKIYGGKEVRSGLIDVGLFQSLTKKEQLDDLLSQYGMVIVDEAHHVAAATFEEVIKRVPSKYIYGLTATPKREDGLENILLMRLGEIRHQVAKEIPTRIKQNLFLRFTGLGEHVSTVSQQTIHENYDLMVSSSERNQQIVKDILDNLQEKRHLIVLTRYVKHLKYLEALLKQAKVQAPIYILNSKMKGSILREELQRLKNEGSPFVLLTTGSYAGEGFDLPALDTLLLAMPVSGDTSMQQYLGRLLRNLDEKEELRVYDYVDYAIPMIYRMAQKRLRIYKRLGYSIAEDNLTELNRSNLFSEDYEALMLSDLFAAKHSFVMILPYLSKKIATALLQLGGTSTMSRTLVLPTKETVRTDYQEIYRQKLVELQALGYHIQLKSTIRQSFVVVDEQLTWLLPEKYEDSGKIALRLFSVEMANRIQKYYLN